MDDSERTPRITMTFNIYRDASREYALYMGGCEEFYSRNPVHRDINLARVSRDMRLAFEGLATRFEEWPQTNPTMESKARDKAVFERLRDAAKVIIDGVESARGQ